MAEPVVDGLEVIDVAHEDNRWQIGGKCRPQGQCRGLVEAAPVEQSGQLIGAGDLGQFAARQRQIPHQKSGSEAQSAREQGRDRHGSTDGRKKYLADADAGIEVGAQLQRQRDRGHDYSEADRHSNAPGRMAQRIAARSNLK
jgi:hypothetical protein